MPREVIVISDGFGEARVLPELGAGLAAYDFRLETGPESVFRPCRDPTQAGPFDLAMNLLAPWSNRISGGGFHHRGRFIALEPNLKGERYPIHGNSFSSVWSVEDIAPDRAVLSLCSEGSGLLHYYARVAYVLHAGALDVTLSIENRADYPLPFGLGLHPWFPRQRGTQLTSVCDRVVLEDDRHLPAGELRIEDVGPWNFNAKRPLPAGWINNAFRGWDGRASIVWPESGLAVEIVADRPLTTFIVYSPGQHADFFCFEPVTHPVDAHNLNGTLAARGLIELKPGEQLNVRCRFFPRALRREDGALTGDCAKAQRDDGATALGAFISYRNQAGMLTLDSNCRA
jgi:aldose 1-epimerase